MIKRFLVANIAANSDSRIRSYNLSILKHKTFDYWQRESCPKACIYIWQENSFDQCPHHRLQNRISDIDYIYYISYQDYPYLECSLFKVLTRPARFNLLPNPPVLPYILRSLLTNISLAFWKSVGGFDTYKKVHI